MSASASGADLGRAVRRLRQALRLTIEALASTADVHPTYLSSIERGKRNPSWKTLCNLADALGVSVPVLVEEAEEEAVITRISDTARLRLKARQRVHHTPARQSRKTSQPGA